VECQGSI